MEHRNSTVLTSRGSLADSRIDLLGTVSHEFSTRGTSSDPPEDPGAVQLRGRQRLGELWLAEGVTSYYDDLLMARPGSSSCRRCSAT